jgi:NTE family protein
MARTGLVLGAGGIVGQAYHAGVLATLERELGWDPRSAEVIVGSSAGSITGAALRLGVAGSDLAAWSSGQPLTPEGQGFFDAIGGAAEDLPSPTASHLLRGWRLPSGRLLTRTAWRPWELRAAAAASTLLPAGRYDLQERTRVLDAFGGHWPQGLWVCAARRTDGRRVVFGRAGAPSARLSQAVAASCAIPTYFAPVRVGRHEYVDGGVHSPTNADVLVRSRLKVVIVVSPMSAAHGSSRSVDAPLRWSAHRRLQGEVRRLRTQGIEVIRIEPDPRTLRVMGINAMAEDRSAEVVAAAVADTAALIATPRLRHRLKRLASSGRSAA